jgi:hypothetical protein
MQPRSDLRSFNFSTEYSENERVGQNDLVLVAAARIGSEPAFAEFHRLYAHRLYTTIYSIAKNREHTEIDREHQGAWACGSVTKYFRTHCLRSGTLSRGIAGIPKKADLQP